MKTLPIGIQSLPVLRERNGIYVDKTALVHQLIVEGKYYFFSRPRRFGKSLLISTFKELFKGNKAVFEGLWIENKWDWTKTSPVLHFSFDEIDYWGMGLADAISYDLKEKAEAFDIKLAAPTFKTQFKNFWFATGSPNFLIKEIKKHNRFDVENVVTNSALLDKYDIENLELIPLLFQTGYLTVKKSDPLTGDLVLDYPNKEVRESMYQFLIDDWIDAVL